MKIWDILGWTENHNHYLGLNAHFIDQEFNRQKIHLECNVFNEKQTGLNIIERVIAILILCFVVLIEFILLYRLFYFACSFWFVN